MRVLITASTLPRWPGDAVPAFVLAQALALRRHDPSLEIELLAPHHAGAAREEAIEGIRIHRFRYFWPASAEQLAYPAILPNLRARPWLVLQIPFLLVAEAVAILKHCRRLRPDVLYSHWFMPQAVAGAPATLLLGIPHVFTTHSSDVAVLSRLPLIGPWLVRSITRRARAFTAVSERTLARLRRFFADSEWSAVAARGVILPMGVDTAALPAAADRPAAREALQIPAGAEVVLFLGRLTAKKGLDILLAAFAQVSAERPRAVLLVAGDGELAAAIDRRIVESGLGARVRRLGFVAGDGKRAVLAAADVMVVPSVTLVDGDTEGLPVSLLEGLAVGHLCIASNASGGEEILDDTRNGLIVPAGDVAALAAALSRALSLDPAARAAMSAAARRRGAEFGWDKLAVRHARHLLGR